MSLSAMNDEMETVRLLDGINGAARRLDNDDCIIDIPSEEGRNMLFTEQDRTLPEGKDYHLFFAYSSEDAIFVRQKVKSLESPPNNLKCCFSDRDFIAGMPIYKNIEILMAKCMKVVLVLTPDFYASGWCLQEERIAIALSANEGIGVIPLVHKPCELPDTLKTLNYIDETRANVADEKIMEAVFTKAGPTNTLSTWLNPRKDFNGAGIVLGSDRKSTCAYSWEIRDVTQNDVDALRDIGADVDLDDLGPLIHTVNNHWSMVSYGFMPCTRHGCGRGCCTGFLMLAIIQLMVAGIIMMSDTSPSVYLFAGTIHIPVNIGVVICSCWCFKKLSIKKAEEKVNAALAKKNLILYRKAKVIVSFRADTFPKVALLFYDSQPCKNHIQEALRNASRIYEQDPNHDLEKEADTLIDKLVTKFAPKFARWEELPPAHNFRHRTKQDKMCLCQLYDFLMAGMDKRCVLSV